MKFPNFIDSDGVAVLLHRGWQAFAGLITLVMISHFLTSQMQGIYYTFASIAAIQTVLDMGLSVVLVQLAAHKFLGLQWKGNGEVVGENKDGFLSFVKCSMRWYGVATLVFFLIYPLGLLFFLDSPDIKSIKYNWEWVWFGLVLFTALNLFIQPFLSAIEGSGQIVATYKLRLLQTVLGAIAAWIVLLAGHGLLAVMMLPLMSSLVSIAWLLGDKLEFVKSICRAKVGQFSWAQEIWPLQWRVGVSWICGYFLTQLYTPILFKAQGAVAAGQMGLSITVINMIGLIALSTMTAKIPHMGQLAASHQRGALKLVFRKSMLSSFSLYLAGAIAVLCILFLLKDTVYHVRFLPWGQFFILMLAMLASNIVNALAVFFRAYRQERLMPLYIVNALFAFGLSCFVAPHWGSAGIVTSLFVINVFLILPLSIVLWSNFRKSLSFSS